MSEIPGPVREGSMEQSGIRGVFLLKTLIPIYLTLLALAGFVVATRAAETLEIEERLTMDIFGAHGFCLCGVTPWLDVAMIATLCVLILAGYPVAFSLAGTAFFRGARPRLRRFRHRLHHALAATCTALSPTRR